MATPLTGLEDIAWESLEHAYGPAIDTPELLKALAEPQPNQSDAEIWNELFSSIAHQGSVYSASAAAVPFLFRLVQHLDGSSRATAIGLLGVIAGAGGFLDGELNDGPFVPPEHGVESECYQAVAKQARTLVPLLTDRCEDVRVATAELLGVFPHLASDIRSRLEEGIRQPHSSQVTREYLRGYLLLHAAGCEEARDFLQAVYEQLPSDVHALVALRLVREFGEHSTDEWIRDLVSAVAGPNRDQRNPLISARDILRASIAIGHQRLLQAFLDQLDASSSPDISFEIGEALVWLAFGNRCSFPAKRPSPFVFVESPKLPMPVLADSPRHMGEDRFVHEIHVRTWESWASKRPPHPAVNVGERVRSSDELTDAQRNVLERLLMNDRFWKTESNILYVYGLPESRSALSALVGMSVPASEKDATERPPRRPWWSFWSRK